MGGRVAIVASSKVAVVGGDDGVGLAWRASECLKTWQLDTSDTDVRLA